MTKDDSSAGHGNDPPGKLTKYTRIRNDILEALARSSAMSEPMRVMHAVMRLTWGYNRKFSDLRLRDLVALTGLSKQHARRGILKAVELNLIRVDGGIYQVNKNHDSWGKEVAPPGYQSSPTGLPQEKTEVAPPGYQSSPTGLPRVPHRATICKERQLKDNLKTNIESTQRKKLKKELDEKPAIKIVLGIPITNTKRKMSGNLQLTDEMRKSAIEKHIANPETTFAKFKSHHLAKGTVMVSWGQAWITWCLNEIEFKGKGQQPVSKITYSNPEEDAIKWNLPKD